MNQEAVETTIAAVSSKASYTTAGAMGIAGWLTSDIVFGLIGVLIGLGTWATNHYFKQRSDRRREAYERLADERDAEYKRRADERAEKEFALRMRRDFGSKWGEL